MKKILFVHNNFPAQFLHIARALAGRKDVAMAAIGTGSARAIPSVKMLRYNLTDSDVSAAHPFARRFDMECRRSEEVIYATTSLTSTGFVPDIVIGHPGWGETLPLRTVFPKAKIITYCEYYYRNEGQDIGFDTEFPQPGLDGLVGLTLKNAATLLALAECDMGLSPTEWQRSTYPADYADKIKVLHDGVDVDYVKPAAHAKFPLPSGNTLTKSDEVITFVTRVCEPLRGYHIFMRALPAILKARPRAQVLIVGGEGNPYGASPPQGQTWQQIFFDEVKDRIDLARVHFVGQQTHANFVRALQISSAHVYLTYPFVLSWSLIEAMSAGCAVIASDTAPLREVIDGENGILVPFFDITELAERVIDVLAHPRRHTRMRTRARQTVVARYDLKRICLPQQLQLLGLDPAESTEQPAVAPMID